MEENIKIQEEFEQLIDQLERLKSINDLTSANAESSREVISSVGIFVKATNEYVKSIELNLSQKSIETDKLILNLEKSILKIESESKQLSTSVGNSFVGFKNETQSNFNEILLELKKALGDNTQKIDSSKKTISESISENTLKIIQNEEEIYLNLSNIFAKNSKILDENLQKQLIFIGQSSQEVIQYVNKRFEILTEQNTKNNAILTEKLEKQNKKISNITGFLFAILGLIILGGIIILGKFYLKR